MIPPVPSHNQNPSFVSLQCPKSSILNCTLPSRSSCTGLHPRALRKAHNLLVIIPAVDSTRVKRTGKTVRERMGSQRARAGKEMMLTGSTAQKEIFLARESLEVAAMMTTRLIMGGMVM
jgi:hypothetical protein